MRSHLTKRQLEILALNASGFRIKDAARELGISTSRAYNTIDYAKRRMGVSTLAACVMRAHALGLLSHPTGPALAVVRDL